MVEKCANPACSQPYIFRQGRLYFCPVRSVYGSTPSTSHGVEHYWLCGSCSKTFTFLRRAGAGVVITPRSLGSAEGRLSPEIQVSGTA